jgi:hypothetical protein
MKRVSRSEVIATRSQGWQVELNTLQSVEQILPEAPFGDACLEIPVRGGDKAHIERRRSPPPHRQDLPRLKDPEQAHLETRGHLSDLIQKEGPA